MELQELQMELLPIAMQLKFVTMQQLILAIVLLPQIVLELVHRVVFAVQELQLSVIQILFVNQ